MSIKTILAALALEEDNDLVGRRALQLASQHAARLILVHVIEDHRLGDPLLPVSSGQTAIAKTLESQAFDRITKLTEGTAVPLQIVIETGRPHAVIDACADHHASDLILIGPGVARNLRESVFGSTADRVVRASTRPVLVVKSSIAEPYRSIVIGIDFSKQSKRAARLAATIAPSAVHELVHVVEIPLSFEQAMLKAGTAQEEIARFRAAKTRDAQERLHTELSEGGGAPSNARVRVALGRPGSALIESSRRRRVDMIALGTRGLDAVAERFLGSVARDVLMAAPCDVLVVPTAL